jgi:hypothetical protein
MASTNGGGGAVFETHARTSFLFDLDGTLVDSVYQHVLAWQAALSEEGIDLSVLNGLGPILMRKIVDLARRIALIEAFLDTELSERQHLATLGAARGDGCGPPPIVNPWYGDSSGIKVSPISVGPIVMEASLRAREPRIRDVGPGSGVDKGDAIEDVGVEGGHSCSKVTGLGRS